MQVQESVLVDFDKGLKDWCLFWLEVAQIVELGVGNTISTPSVALPK